MQHEPRIALEEVEVTLLKKGGEMKRMRVSDEESISISNSIRDQVLEKLGVKTFREAKRKEMLDKFDEEMRKLIRLERITPPVLTFYDEKGQIIQKIVMKRPGKTGTAGDREGAAGEEYSHYSQSIGRDAVVSGNGRYAAVTEYFAGRSIADDGQLETWSSVRFFDVRGNVLWIRVIPEDMYVNSMAISYDGKRIAYVQIHERGGNGEHPGLVVLNNEEEELFRFPEGKGGRIEVISSFLRISPNGRYVGVSGRTRDKKRVGLYFDLRNGTFREARKNHIPSMIEDNGVAKIRWYDEDEEIWEDKKIDLKQYLAD